MLSQEQRHSARTMDRQRSRLARLASLQYALAQAAFHEGRREDAIQHVRKAEHYQSMMDAISRRSVVDGGIDYLRTLSH